MRLSKQSVFLEPESFYREMWKVIISNKFLNIWNNFLTQIFYSLTQEFKRKEHILTARKFLFVANFLPQEIFLFFSTFLRQQNLFFCVEKSVGKVRLWCLPTKDALSAINFIYELLSLKAWVNLFLIKLTFLRRLESNPLPQAYRG